MNISGLLDLPLLQADLDRVEGRLRDSVTAEDPFLTEVALHLVSAGGKRIRPALAVAAAAAGRSPGDGEATDDVLLGGVSVELVHLGSLYHDDVMDGAATRRGVETVNARWGNLVAIIAGDFLLAKASEIAAGLGNEVAGLLAATIGRLCQGQVLEMRTTFDVHRSEPSYFSAIAGKTAALMSAACRIGSLTAGHDRQTVETLTAFGHAFGMAFQICDDVLDVVGTDESLGKPAGLDLVAGVYTLPVIRTLAAGGDAAAELVSLLGSPVDDAVRDKARGIVRSSSGVASAVTTAREYADEAARAAAATPAGEAVGLGQLAHALVDDLPLD